VQAPRTCIGKMIRRLLFLVTHALAGPLHLVGDVHEMFGAEEGSLRLAQREPRPDLCPHPSLPEDTRLWAALIQASGGVWGGCVYDNEKILPLLEKHHARPPGPDWKGDPAP